MELRGNGRSPTDQDGKTYFLLSQLWQVYRNHDSKRKNQKALPMMVLRKMLQLSSSLWEHAVSWILIGAICFAMWSCEYLETNVSEEKLRTKIIRMKNIVFKKDGTIFLHLHPLLQKSGLAIITFEFQKKQTNVMFLYIWLQHMTQF